MTIQTETYPATVTSNQDPEERGRIRVACVGLLGDEDAELPMFVEPILDWGWFVVPDVDEIIEIEVVTASHMDENFGQASIDNLDIKWRGQRFYGNSEGDEPTVVHEFFTAENYGKRRGFATPFGHVIMFDDTARAPKIVITWTSEKQETADDKISQITFDTDGSVKLSVLGKHSIHLKENEIEMKLAEGAALKIIGKDSAAATVLGDGGVKAAIADHLETFYTSLIKVHLEALFVPTAFGPSGPASAGIGPAPTWDATINSNKLRFPDG